jgi:TonB family protein
LRTTSAGNDDAEAGSSDAGPQFELIETSRTERRRWRASLGASAVVQVIVLAALVWFVTVPFGPEKLATNTKPTTFTLLAPPPENLSQRPRPQPRHVVLRHTLAPVNQPRRMVWKPVLPQQARVTKPEVQPHRLLLPRTSPTVAPRIEAFRATVPRWKPRTHVGAFGGKRVVATVKLPRSKVQTGGFGNPKGIAGIARNNGDLPQVGSFDRAAGPGSGNGSGGAHGAKGLVASAGFGDGMAGGTGNADAPAGDGQTHTGGFGDAAAAAPSTAHPKIQPAVAAFEPVEITSKPDPIYTAEARRMRVQGTVILRVDFKASGEVQILGLVRGLGHGLDQAAMRAAQQIQFKPARRDGQPVDAPAVLHILFRLAD